VRSVRPAGEDALVAVTQPVAVPQP